MADLVVMAIDQRFPVRLETESIRCKLVDGDRNTCGSNRPRDWNVDFEREPIVGVLGLGGIRGCPSYRPFFRGRDSRKPQPIRLEDVGEPGEPVVYRLFCNRSVCSEHARQVTASGRETPVALG